MVKLDNRLFVSNSGGLNYPVYDSTVTVIDMSNNEVIETFETRINSSQMVVDAEGEIYLVSRGNYDDVDPAILRIDADSYTVIETIDINASSLNILGDWMYFYDGESEEIKRYNTLSETVGGTVLDVSDFQTFYGFQLDVENELLYAFDAKGYVNSSIIRVYSLMGEFQYEFTAALNAKKMIING